MAWHCGHFWSAVTGAPFAVLRRRLRCLDTRRLGTAMGRLLGQVFRLGNRCAGGTLAQRIPAGIGCHGLAVASSVIQVGTAFETQSLAILPAIHESWHREEPSFAYSWSYVELMCAGIVRKYVRIVFGSWIVSGGEEEMCILVHVPGDLGKALPTVQLHRTGKASAKVEAAITGTGKPPLDMNRVERTRIGRSPDGIVGRKVTNDLRGYRLQGADVEGQHSHIR